MCPALPDVPSISLPSRTRPPPTPVDTTMPSMLLVPRPAPRQCSPAAMQIASLCTRTGRPGKRSASLPRSGKDRHAGMFSGETRPDGHSIGPPQPQPTPARSAGPPLIFALRSARLISASRVRHSCPASRSRRVGVCSQAISRPPGSATPAASFVPPMSTARPGRAARSAQPPASTLAQLRASEHKFVTVKQEIRQNLLARLRAGEDAFPGIIGFGQTVLPQLERSLLAGHDVMLLGERGQGKTRLIRTLTGLLDDWTPTIAGCEINDHPYAPVCARCRRLAAAEGDDLQITWRHRSDRYGEKLATPDTSVGDLIGDIDPVKVAEGRTLGDPETIHFGLVPRTNRGVFCLNELPDLAERIQVALLNVLEERDIGIRGYALRLPLDLLLVASANPEDYTNRGRIITPLKDRFGAEIRTHYPVSLA